MHRSDRTVSSATDVAAGAEVASRTEAASGIDELTRTGKCVRLAAAAVVAVLTLAGTVHGQDSDFPFGPFRMYATRDDPNGTVRIVAVQTVDVDGRVHDVTNAHGAPRRAELEGRMSTLRTDCDQFALLVPRYSPAADVVTVRLVEQDYPLRHGRRQGRHDDVVCTVAWPRR